MPTLTEIIAELRRDPTTYEGKTDAEAAALMAVPTKTPKPTRQTFTDISGVLGGVRAATFRAGLRVAQKSDNPTIAAMSSHAEALLDGNGLNPAHADAETFAAAFVAAGLCTRDEADAILYTIIYPVAKDVSESEVAEARKRLEKVATAQARREAIEQFQSREWRKVDLWEASGFDGDLADVEPFGGG